MPDLQQSPMSILTLQTRLLSQSSFQEYAWSIGMKQEMWTPQEVWITNCTRFRTWLDPCQDSLITWPTGHCMGQNQRQIFLDDMSTGIIIIWRWVIVLLLEGVRLMSIIVLHQYDWSYRIGLQLWIQRGQLVMISLEFQLISCLSRTLTLLIVFRTKRHLNCTITGEWTRVWVCQSG